MAARLDQPTAASGARLDFKVIERRLDDMEISKAELAERLGIDPATIWRWERGALPRLDTLTRLAEALGVTVNKLIGQGSPTPRPAPGPSTPPPPPAPPTPTQPTEPARAE